MFLLFVGEEIGVPASGTAMVLMVMGITDIVGRLIFGALFDLKPAQNRKHFFLAWLGVLLGKISSRAVNF